MKENRAAARGRREVAKATPLQFCQKISTVQDVTCGKRFIQSKHSSTALAALVLRFQEVFVR